MTSTVSLRSVKFRRKHHLIDNRHLLDADRGVGPVDRASLQEVLDLIDQMPLPAARRYQRARITRSATTILAWLLGYPGEGWQQRWIAADADTDLGWIDKLAPEDPRGYETKRNEHVKALSCLLLCRVVLPSYEFLTNYNANSLLILVRDYMRPDLFTRIAQDAHERQLSGRDLGNAQAMISKMVLFTGRNVDQLTTVDVLRMHAWWTHISPRGKAGQGLYTAWDLLSSVGVTPRDVTLRAALRQGPRPTADLVDRYGIRCAPVRDVLVRYLDERRPALDHGSLNELAGILAGAFWADIEEHHPGIDSLRLPADVVEAWKQRIRVVTTVDGTQRPRKDVHRVLTRVRIFYVDIQQWALDDPSWALFAVPSPVRKADTAGRSKASKKVQSEMHNAFVNASHVCLNWPIPPSACAAR